MKNLESMNQWLNKITREEKKTQQPDDEKLNLPARLTPLTAEGINKLPSEQIKTLLDKMEAINPLMVEVRNSVMEIENARHIKKWLGSGKINLKEYISNNIGKDDNLSPPEKMLNEVIDPERGPRNHELKIIRDELKADNIRKATEPLSKFYQPLQEALFDQLNFEDALLLLSVDLDSPQPQDESAGKKTDAREIIALFNFLKNKDKNSFSHNDYLNLLSLGEKMQKNYMALWERLLNKSVE